MDLELIALERSSQCHFEVDAFGRSGAHGPNVEYFVPASPATNLGLVHGHVGVMKNIVASLVGRRECDTNADGHDHFVTLGKRNGVEQLVEDALGDGDGILRCSSAFEEDWEFVPSEPSQHVAGAQSSLKSLG